jgi:PHD/YefM family antitoxin component YafN of YafNO toxin-antitoxin module
MILFGIRYFRLIIYSLNRRKVKEGVKWVTSRVFSTDEEVMITKNGRPSAVLVSPDEFESWKETIAVKGDSQIMDEIEKGLGSLKRKSRLYTLEELL